MRRGRLYGACLGLICLCLATLNLAFPPPIASVGHVSAVVTDRDGQWLAAFPVEDGRWRIPADLDGIDPRFVDSVIAIEDKRFYDHSGVDVPAILRAARSWVRSGEPVSGASTITMQLVRQLETRPRTFGSKIKEAVRAVQIELWLDKSEILAAYLTHSPYGGNIEGLEAASRIYLGKPPDKLRIDEIALLIALPQAPEARHPVRNPTRATASRNIILEKLLNSEAITMTEYGEAQNVPLTATRHEMPEIAWITAYGLAQTGQVTQTTLDRRVQRDVTAVTDRLMANLPEPTNIAITVIENETMAVRAHIASSDRSRPGGWIDMTAQKRSPGSTLKPFIYGLAMDDGLIAAGSTVTDMPTRFGNYQPENFTRRYHGQVRIDEALRHSLNVPAVAVLDAIGSDRLEQTLRHAGVRIDRPAKASERAGLALALGGAGLTVNDVGMLYAALANGGQARALRWRENDPVQRSVPMVSADSAEQLTHILRQAPIPSGHVPSWLTQGSASLAYKTGTSYGFRDAWAAGYTDDWTVVVWVGRPDGAPRLGETGRKTAAPILFDVFDRLPHNARNIMFTRDADAPTALSRLGEDVRPHIIFPPDGAEIFAPKLGPQSRGFTLTTRSEAEPVELYINGKRLPGKVWRPQRAGFYTIDVVDQKGLSARSTVRVTRPSRRVANDQSVNTPL